MADGATEASAERTDELLARIVRQREAAERGESDLRRREQAQEIIDRSAITNTVMTPFGLALILCLAILLLAGLGSGKWETLGSAVADILKSVLLPVVTLVLGDYFGRGGKG